MPLILFYACITYNSSYTRKGSYFVAWRVDVELFVSKDNVYIAHLLTFQCQ